MLISELKNSIVTGNLNNFYIFTGDEEGIMSIYIKQIVKKLGLTIKWVDSIQEVSKLLNLKSLVKVKYLYLVRQDKTIKGEENAWSFLKDGIKGSYIILIEPTLDKKTKFYKFFEDIIIKFEKMPVEMLTSYGKKICPSLSKDNIIKLIDWCGNSYSRLMNELDKIKILGKVMSVSDDIAFDILDRDNGIYKERQFDILKYSNYILTRNKDACYREYDYAKSQNCELGLIGLLRASFRNLVLLKNDGGGKGVCDRTGLTGWQVKCAVEVDEYFNIDECENILLFLQETERKIKTGALDINVALRYLLAEIL